MSRQKVSQAAILDAITDLFLLDGKSHSAEEIAECVGVSVGTMRRRLNDPIDGVSATRESRTSYSRSYRGFEAGTHHVWLYAPTRGHLRQLLLTARKLDPSVWKVSQATD